MLLPDVFVSVPQAFAGDCSGDGSDGRAARSPNGSFDFLRENGARIQEHEQDDHNSQAHFYQCLTLRWSSQVGTSASQEILCLHWDDSPVWRDEGIGGHCPQGRQAVDQDEVVPAFTDSIQ